MLRVADYMMVDVIPVSDPNSSTMAQRVVQYQAVLQMAQSAPQIYDLPQLHRQMIEVLGVKNADKLVPTQDDLKPTDPVSENMDALNGKPLESVYIPRSRRAHNDAPSVYARPYGGPDDWSEPTGTSHYGRSASALSATLRV